MDPKRLSPQGPADDIVELAAAPAVPKRARTGKLARIVLAPMAFLAVFGLAATSMVLASDDEGVAHTDPITIGQPTPMRVSRDLPRPELPNSAPATPTATATASSTPSVAPAPLPTATATATSTPTPTPTPTPSPTPSATVKKEAPKPKAKPAPDYSELWKSAGKRAATSPVNIRKGPGTGFDTVGSLAEGSTITITEREIDGWRQVVYKKRAGWIKGSYLGKVEDKPAAPAKSTKTSAKSGSSTKSTSESTARESTSSTAGKCSKAGSLERNLTKRTANVLRVMCAKFPGISSYGGYRPGSGSYHGSGQAIDAMVSGDYGWQVAKWARANASSLGIVEVIYQQKIWTTQRSGDGWRSMSDRGSASANHYDHVHISVR